MAKNRNKKNKNGVAAAAMDTSERTTTNTVSDAPQAMDTSESKDPVSAAASMSRKIKGRPMKRTKNVRKMKAVAKAIASREKSSEKVIKFESKTLRTQYAKILYE